MKGLVFTTFYDFCEVTYGADLLDDVIEAAHLPNGGAYTSVGTYPFTELTSLVTQLVAQTGIELKLTLEAFGEHCFDRWVENWPSQFAGRKLFDVLSTINDFHEKQVRKLYPDAELPSFHVETRTPERLVLGYHSCKPLGDLAVGVIKGASNYLDEPVHIRSETVPNGGAPYIRMEINRAA